jgi:RNA polymerase sigma-70 factor (ECF subfamily)
VEDSDLVSLHIKGNPDTLDILVHRHKDSLYRFCYHLTSNKSEAEDLFQDTWLKVVDKVKSYDVNKKFSTWLYTIALNLYRDRYRKAKRWLSKVRLIFEDEEGNSEFERISSEEAAVCEQVVQHELKRELVTVINGLKDTYRIPLILFYYKEMTYEDIAQILDIPMGTVKSRLNSCKRILKEEMEGRNFGKR